MDSIYSIYIQFAINLCQRLEFFEKRLFLRNAHNEIGGTIELTETFLIKSETFMWLVLDVWAMHLMQFVAILLDIVGKWLVTGRLMPFFFN